MKISMSGYGNEMCDHFVDLNAAAQCDLCLGMFVRQQITREMIRRDVMFLTGMFDVIMTIGLILTISGS